MAGLSRRPATALENFGWKVCNFCLFYDPARTPPSQGSAGVNFERLWVEWVVVGEVEVGDDGDVGDGWE